MNADATPPVRPDRDGLTRRGLLATGAAMGLGLVAACGGPDTGGSAAASGTSGAPAGTSGTAAQSAGAGTGAAPATASTGPAGPSTGPTLPADGSDVVHGPATAPLVALTFHGQGDPAIAAGVLAACATAGAQITVFAVGQWAAANPDVIRRIAAAGHDVGNHTWSHQEMPTLGAAAAKTEVARCADALRSILGYPGRWFRPSGTQYSTPTIRAAATAAGYPCCISYDVDPEDYTDPGAAAVRSRTAAHLHPGAIVSLHLGHQGTLQALPGVLADVHAAGLTAVTVTRLLGGS